MRREREVRRRVVRRWVAVGKEMLRPARAR
jgi:hypothetical protein